jgi:hypothetical protein
MQPKTAICFLDLKAYATRPSISHKLPEAVFSAEKPAREEKTAKSFGLGTPLKNRLFLTVRDQESRHSGF